MSETLTEALRTAARLEKEGNTEEAAALRLKIREPASAGHFENPEVTINKDELVTPTLFSVAGKNVLVTGGGRGIGLMIAAGFAANGARVCVSSRDAAACDVAVTRLNDLGTGGCFAVAADLADEAECDRLRDAVATEFGGQLHALINNSGSSGRGFLDSYDMEEFKRPPTALAGAVHRAVVHR